MFVLIGRFLPFVTTEYVHVFVGGSALLYHIWSCSQSSFSAPIFYHLKREGIDLVMLMRSGRQRVDRQWAGPELWNSQSWH